MYHLHNSGPDRKLDLLFASGSASVADFQVWFDGQPVGSAPAPDAKLPESWQAPTHTPGLHGESEVPYPQRRSVAPLAFTIVIPAGSHELRVCYSAEASIYHHGDPTVYRQFAYVLAPARAWSGFGTLDVSIYLPENWHAACSPALSRDGNTLKGSFTELPSDAIALTVQAPEPWTYRPLACASLMFLGVVGIGGGVACWRGGRTTGQRLAAQTGACPGWLARHAWPMSLGMSFAWGLAVLGAGLFAVFGPDQVLPSHQASHYGYGQAFAMLSVVLLSLVAIPGGFLIAQLTASVVSRRAEQGAAAYGSPISALESSTSQ